MADRFEELARDVHREMEGCDTWPETYAVLAAAIRAESKRAQEAMREQCAKWHEEQIERVKRDWPDSFAMRIRTVVNGHRVDAAAIRSISIEE